MSATLISCVGKRDPFDLANCRYYGPVLASVLEFRPESVYLLCTTGTELGAKATSEHIKRLYPSSTVHILHLNLEDPSDYHQCDIELRRALMPIAKTHDSCIVNLSPGTPQLSTTLNVLLSTGFITGQAVRISDPQFSKEAVAGTKPVASIGDNPEPCITETAEQACGRVKKLTGGALSIVEHIRRCNAIELCKRHDYLGAIELLSVAYGKKEYTKKVLPLLELAAKLFILDVDSAKAKLPEVKTRWQDGYPYEFTRLEELIEQPKPVALFLVTQIKHKIGRLDDFVRCAGLTREVLLQHYIDQTDLSKHFSKSLKQPSRGAKYLEVETLRTENPELLEHIMSRFETYSASGSKSDLQKLELMAKVMESIVDWACSKDYLPPRVAEIISGSEKLASYRNKFAHEVRALNAQETKELFRQFETLKEVLPASARCVDELAAPLEPLNRIIEDVLLYWGTGGSVSESTLPN